MNKFESKSIFLSVIKYLCTSHTILSGFFNKLAVF